MIGSIEIMKLKFREVFRLILLVTPRLVSALMSVLVFSTMAHQLSDFHFSMVQITYSVAVFFLWVADLGSLNLMISERFKKGHEYTQGLWVNRITRIIVMTIPVGVISYFYPFQKFSFFIFLACVLDSTADSLIGFRQVALAPRWNYWLQLGRKATQLLGIITVWRLQLHLTLSYVFIIILVPALVALAIEYVSIGHPSWRPSFRVSNKSVKVWFQSGGTLIASIDLWIIGIHGAYASILYVSLARRVSSALGIIGATTSVETLHEVGKSMYLSGAVKSSIRRAVLITICFAVILISSLRLWLPVVSGRDPALSSYLIVAIIVGSIPVGVITSNLNSIFIGFQKFNYAGFSTYGSSIVYLSWLTLMPHYIGIVWSIALGTFINLSTELLIQTLLFKKNNGFTQSKLQHRGEKL